MLRSFQRLRQPLLSSSKKIAFTCHSSATLRTQTLILTDHSLNILSKASRFYNAAFWATCQKKSLFHSSTFINREQQQQQQQQQGQQPQKSEEEAVNPKHQMLIGFTCRVCNERTHHVMSKLAYTKGVVLIQCPGCKNRHLIADNLGWFRDNKTTVEDLVKEKGEAIRKVVVDDQGVERLGDLMEWLPEIVEEEKQKKERQANLKTAEDGIDYNKESKENKKS